MDIYGTLRKEFRKITRNTMGESISISARSLSVKEAIGEPDRDDYPLLKGKEAMVEAIFRGSKGHAFTDMPGVFQGTMGDILELPLDEDNFRRAIFIASLNAVLRELGIVAGTVHCKDKEPVECARELVDYVKNRFGNPRIAFVGFQPAMIERLSDVFDMRVVDLDEDNIGKEKFGLVIEGPDSTQAVLASSDIILATGSTCVNGTITRFIGEKPVIFFGVSISGAAEICGFDRYCRYPH